MSSKPVVGVIGGSGFYDPDMLSNTKEVKIHTPYGPASDVITIGELNGLAVAFLPRHGRSHTIPPHMINSRANIWALSSLGVERILAPSAVGSLKEDIPPGTIVLPDQFLDMTKGRAYTFYDGPKVAHISMADPFCPEVRRVAGDVAERQSIPCRIGGTYVCIEGPRFSTRAESRTWRTLGGDIVGMTLVPEINLARELGMCYTTLALVTDFDVWAERPVTAKEVAETQKRNLEKAKKIIFGTIPAIQKRSCSCRNVLDEAFV